MNQSNGCIFLIYMAFLLFMWFIVPYVDPSSLSNVQITLHLVIVSIGTIILSYLKPNINDKIQYSNQTNINWSNLLSQTPLLFSICLFKQQVSDNATQYSLITYVCLGWLASIATKLVAQSVLDSNICDKNNSCDDGMDVKNNVILDKQKQEQNGKRKSNFSISQIVSPMIMTPKSNLNVKRQDYLKWDEYFMFISLLSSMRSKDPNTQVGACIVNIDKKIVGIGYNGFPWGCCDDILPWQRKDLISNDENNTKYPYVCHAEMNAILNKNESSLKDCTMYVVLFPCNECAKLIIQSRISKIVYFYDKYKNTKKVIASKRLLDMAKVKYVQFKPKRTSVHLRFPDIDNVQKNLNFNHDTKE